MSFKVEKEITPQQLAARLKQNEEIVIIDVREPAEWSEGHIESAKHIPLGQLLERQHELDPKQETIIVCRSGNRSGLACELLGEKGFNAVNMIGGMNEWTDTTV
ncbi:rhodanese-like domain-containing protein [Paenibacillus sp. FSL R10-2782]|uniref:Sulfurtransferase n=1 Tax=Paenibacillus terrae TaxID=159743 RepID=A0A4U2PQA8_9BACL|nr:rhodanese-like domain-containing protein [Paenibacillus terrae]TKH41473.1 sulfurtransferase [Paenibacillus terrae]